MRKIIFFIISIFFYRIGYSQSFGHGDSISMKKAAATIKNNFNISEKDNYLLFSDADKWFLVIIQKDNLFYEYYIDSDTSNYKLTTTKTLKILKKNPLLLRIFNEKNYKKDYITFTSPFYKGGYNRAEGNITYFYLIKNGTKYGEALLSMEVDPNPIDSRIYNYLLVTLGKFMLNK
jgi:hypothetical protein